MLIAERWHVVSLTEEMRNFIGELYLKYSEKLLIVAIKRVENESVAQDMVDQTFEIAILKAESLYAHPHKLAWLYTVLDFCIRKYRVANTYRKTVINEQGEKTIEYEYIQSVPIDELLNPLSIEESFYEGVLFEYYKEILTEKEMKYLLYRFEYGLETTEISELLGTTDTATTSFGWRIRNKIKKFLNQA